MGKKERRVYTADGAAQYANKDKFIPAYFRLCRADEQLPGRGGCAGMCRVRKVRGNALKNEKEYKIDKCGKDSRKLVFLLTCQPS